MKYVKTTLAAAVLVTAAHHPLNAQQRTATIEPQPHTAPVQIVNATAPAVRNITAAGHPARQWARRANAKNVHPSGAQALMVLGIALIVTPAMFRGTFAN